MFAHTSSSVFPGRQLLVTTVIELNAMYTACILQYTFLFFVFCERSLSYAVYYLLLYFSVEQIEVCMQQTRPPLFQRVPPWWARWSLGLIACDIFMTGSVIELTWNHWSTLVSDLENASVKSRDVSLSFDSE
ncbi:hypothetical protein L208DRAFT_1539037 [Tricholoma matsutake]|nr:hypothetical protein L208DRAFT_1539037 [Tricholoma matsutake 945]